MITIKCKQCNKDFKIFLSELVKAKQRGIKREYCGRKCYGEALSDMQKGNKNHQWNGTGVEIRCLNCGKLFLRSHKSRKFCCSKCIGDYWKKTGLHPRTNRKKRKCDNCGKDLIRTDYFNNKKVFCGRRCADKFHSLRMEGINNPNWKGGIGHLPYKYDFANKLKKRIRNRFNNKCFLCNKNRNEVINNGSGFGLAIHHIDYDKMNSEESNLIPLCNYCHGKTHYGRKKWKNLLSKMLENWKVKKQMSTI